MKRILIWDLLDTVAVIACDTDFLIKIANDPLPKFDWQTLSRQNEFCTLPSIVRELSNLKSSRQRQTAKRAVMALSIVGAHSTSKVKVLTVESTSNRIWIDKNAPADEALIAFVSEEQKSRMVATLDGDLLSRLEAQGMPYMTLSSDRPLIAPRRAMHLTRTGDFIY